MKPILVQSLFGIEGLNINTYGLMVAIGVLICLWVLNKYGKKLGLSDKLLDFAFYAILGSLVVGIGFAALFQSLYEYIANPSAGFHITGDLTFIGGLIGGVACFVVICLLTKKKRGESALPLILIIPCCVTVAHGFGRVGCFFAGCCYGKPTDCFLGVQFPGFAGPVHPTQLYESAFLFVLFAVLSVLLLKKKFRYTMNLYLICYGVFRFFIEFIRDDYRGEFVTGVTPSQFWSLVFIVAGAAMIPLMKKLPLFPAPATEAEDAETEENGEEPAEEAEAAPAAEAEETEAPAEEEAPEQKDAE